MRRRLVGRTDATMIRPRKLNAVSLVVRDLERSLAWYKEKFGFEKLYDDSPNSTGVVVGARGVELVLKQAEGPRPAIQTDGRGRLGIELFGFEVDEADLERVEGEFPEDHDIVALDDHPRYRSRIVEDPDGHAIELSAER